MTAVRDVSREEDDSALPDLAAAADVLDLEPPAPERDRRAAGGRNGRTTAAPIGESATGTFGVDMKKDGPHALVAGTTGSGKSELLQSIIASLAVGNPPDAMTFVLVDYKGGAAFKDCVDLPHTVGMVTDLDGHLTERALESLSAELQAARAHPRPRPAPRTSRTTGTPSTRRVRPPPGSATRCRD